MSSLIIAAHPDDEVLGCGGTITRLINEKEPVYVAILGEGITSVIKIEIVPIGKNCFSAAVLQRSVYLIRSERIIFIRFAR